MTLYSDASAGVTIYMYVLYNCCTNCESYTMHGPFINCATIVKLHAQFACKLQINPILDKWHEVYMQHTQPMIVHSLAIPVHPLTHIVHFLSQFGSLNTASGIC